MYCIANKEEQGVKKEKEGERLKRKGKEGSRGGARTMGEEEWGGVWRKDGGGGAGWEGGG